MTVRLSTEDLRLFFEDGHRTLAKRLSASVGALEEQYDAGKVALRLGRDLDLVRLVAPEDGALDVRAVCLAREALGQVSPLADAILAVQGLGARPIALAGTDEQRGTLAGVRTGEVVGGFGLTEPEAGSDVKAMRTTATREGSEWVLDGEKTFISNAGIATRYTVFARVGDQFAAFLVPAGTPGLSVEAIPMSVPHPIGRLTFRGARVPASALVGAVGDGLKLALATLGAFRVSVAAAAVGMARRALDETRAHVLRRRQFGRPLAEQQLVQAYVAEMATRLDAARLLTWRAAHALDTTGGRCTEQVSMAKAFATEAAQDIVDKAVQLHGGLGVTSGTVVERLYREVRPLRIYEGTTEIQRLIIAREVLGE